MNAITIKALVWSEEDRVFKSPSRGSAWPRDDWMKASCSRHIFEEILDPNIGFPNAQEGIKGWPCSCGLYGATQLQRVQRYKWSRNSLIFAMESRGNYEAWTGGLRSQEMRPIAIVGSVSWVWTGADKDNLLHDYMQILHKGINYFNLGGTLQVVPYHFVKDWMRETWEQGEIGEYHGD